MNTEQEALASWLLRRIPPLDLNELGRNLLDDLAQAGWLDPAGVRAAQVEAYGNGRESIGHVLLTIHHADEHGFCDACFDQPFPCRTLVDTKLVADDLVTTAEPEPTVDVDFDALARFHAVIDEACQRALARHEGNHDRL